MKVLGIGSNGREHAYAWKIAQSPRVTDMVWTPRNAGIPREIVRKTGNPIRCYDISADNIPGILDIAGKEMPDLIAVGPENPYALGIVNQCRALGYPIWGPTQEEARFESSKVYAHQFMQEFGIPHAPGKACSDHDEAIAYAKSLDWRCAVKKDGLALGKGVTVCRGEETKARAAIDEAFKAGPQILIQELQEGEELSAHYFLDGKTAHCFPSSLDHKGELEGNLGLNSGGLGTISPHPTLPDGQFAGIAESIIKPFFRGCNDRQLKPNGILYPGIMLTPEGPRVLEFNFRGGGTETETYMTKLETDLVDIIEASMMGTLDRLSIVWRPIVTVCVVMASKGYPGPYEKGKRVRGLEAMRHRKNLKVFEAGTKLLPDGTVVTDGGRVLSVTGWGELGEERESVRRLVYSAIDSDLEIEGGAHVRRDIGGKPL